MDRLKDLYQRIRDDLDLAIRANGGPKHRQEWCQCEPEVGHYPCEYCAIFNALDHFKRLLNIDNRKIQETSP